VLCKIARIKLFEILGGKYGKRKDFLEIISRDVNFLNLGTEMENRRIYTVR